MHIVTGMITAEAVKRTVNGKLTKNCIGFAKLAGMDAPDQNSSSAAVQTTGFALRCGVLAAGVTAAAACEVGYIASSVIKAKLGFSNQPSSAGQRPSDRSYLLMASAKKLATSRPVKPPE